MRARLARTTMTLVLLLSVLGACNGNQPQATPGSPTPTPGPPPGGNHPIPDIIGGVVGENMESGCSADSDTLEPIESVVVRITGDLDGGDGGSCSSSNPCTQTVPTDENGEYYFAVYPDTSDQDSHKFTVEIDTGHPDTQAALSGMSADCDYDGGRDETADVTLSNTVHPDYLTTVNFGY